LGDVEAGTAVLARPGVGQPALLPERLLPHDVVVAIVVPAGEGLLARRGRQRGAGEGTHLVGERLVLGLQRKVHDVPPSAPSGGARRRRGVIVPAPSWR